MRALQVIKFLISNLQFFGTLYHVYASKIKLDTNHFILGGVLMDKALTQIKAILIGWRKRFYLRNAAKILTRDDLCDDYFVSLIPSGDFGRYVILPKREVAVNENSIVFNGGKV